jgi:hypothetical protein
MDVKDVAEYRDHAERRWKRLGIVAEAIGGRPTFEYVSRAGRPYHAVGHHLVRLTFGVEDAYMKVDEWLVGERGRIRRESYVYELIHQGGILEEWHRHVAHGNDHTHATGIDGNRVRVPASISLKRAEEISLRLLWSETVPN